MSKNWTNPVALNLENIGDLKGKSGIYKVFLDDPSIKSINRFKGNDSKKIMCIGKSENLKRRLYGFMRGLQKGAGHSEGNLMFLINKNFKEELRFRFSYQLCAKSKLVRTEAEEIYQYIKKYGEVPVLNSSIPSKKELIQQLLKK